MIDFGFSHGLYSVELRKSYMKYCFDKEADKKTCQQTVNEINELIRKVNIYSIYDVCYTPPNLSFLEGDNSNGNKFQYTPWVFLDEKDSQKSERNLKFLSESKPSYGHSPPCVDEVGFNTYYNRKEVKLALNVRLDLPEFRVCTDVNYNIDREKGSYYLYPALIKSGMRIWKFSGDTDAVVPFNGTLQWISNLKLPILEKWRSWTISDPSNIGGYVTKYDGLTFLTVKGAGHMVPQFKPKESFYMLTAFLNGKDL